METLEEFEGLRELIETKQYTRLRQELAEMNDADIASFLEQMDGEDMLKIFRILPKSMAADVFSYLEIENQSFAEYDDASTYLPSVRLAL